MMTTKQLSDLDRIKQSHLGVKGSIRADEKISVAYPASWGPVKRSWLNLRILIATICGLQDQTLPKR
jgi:hypothetical protein